MLNLLYSLSGQSFNRISDSGRFQLSMCFAEFKRQFSFSRVSAESFFSFRIAVSNKSNLIRTDGYLSLTEILEMCCRNKFAVNHTRFCLRLSAKLRGRKVCKWEIPLRNCHYDASIPIQTTIICSETSSCQYPHYRQSNTLQLALLLTYNFINPRCRYSRLGLPSSERWSRSDRRKIVRVTHSYPAIQVTCSVQHLHIAWWFM